MLLTCACGKRETRVSAGIRDQILHAGNGTEPQDLDPHVTTGEPEHKVLMAIIEGLVTEDPKDLSPRPGMAETWDKSPNGTIYTFHLRKNAVWSNGDPVTAHDFIKSFERMLSPALSAEYSYMLFPMTNAEAFNKGDIKDFTQVGAKALNDHTLQVTLHTPIPYFLALITHNSWFPVHLETVKKHGGIADRSNRWTLPENYVGNGAFLLKEWKMNSYIMLEKNPAYWDAANVKLNKIYLYPTENIDAEERAFRAGMLHITKDVPQMKIRHYQTNFPHLIRAEPILTTYFYRFNVTSGPLKDKRVRKALAMALDRESLVKNVTRGGQVPAYNLTPPGFPGFNPTARLTNDLAAAKKLLADAGYPDGKGFPGINILFNTHEGHRSVAEAIQQMWKKNLNINVTLRNEEWKVFLTTLDQLDFQVARAGWGADYVDPNSFLDMFITGGGNNQTGWSNAEYDSLLKESARTGDPEKRFALLERAETILMDEVPISPLYFYTRPTLIHPSVKGFYPTPLDLHPWKYVYLDPTTN